MFDLPDPPGSPGPPDSPGPPGYPDPSVPLISLVPLAFSGQNCLSETETESIHHD